MRNILIKILQILDGTPSVYGKRQRGQSLVELALVTPILIVLLAALVEIGWFANNYLILMEVARVGARAGTVRNGDDSPTVYSKPQDVTYAPNISGSAVDSILHRDCDNVTSETYTMFYNVLGCIMLNSMEPLDLRGRVEDNAVTTTNNVDDIVISVFSVLSVDPAQVANRDAISGTNFAGALDRSKTGARANDQQMIVVGRYPANANECTDGTANLDGRDPFNYIENANPAPDVYTVGTIPYYVELVGGIDSGSEQQRGFSWTGNHIISGTSCYGSEWSIQRIQDLMNLSDFDLDGCNIANCDAAGERRRLPSQGIVLVEVFWEHTLLLDLPGFSYVYEILGGGDNRATISVWAAFPAPAADPANKIEF
jgi:Flp pilus assembly protein TadG